MTDYRVELKAWKQRNQELSDSRTRLYWLIAVLFFAWLCAFVAAIW